MSNFYIFGQTPRREVTIWCVWWRGIVDLCLSVVGLIIVLVLLPLVLPLLLLLWAWRCLAVVLVHVLHRRRAFVATGMEALFALDSSGARAVISGITVLRGQVSVATVRKLLSERVLEARDSRGNYQHPKFRQVVEKRCGVVVWMWEDNFHVNSHVRRMRKADCRPRLLNDENDILSEVSARTNLPFVRGQARWEVLVAPLRKFGAQKQVRQEWSHTVVLVRLHHSIGDGRSVFGLIVSALADKPMGDPRPSPVSSIPRGSCMGRVARLLWSCTHMPWVLGRVLTCGDSSVLHGSRLCGYKILAWSPPLSLAAVKTGRSLAGVSVNDLLLAGLAAALTRYMEAGGQESPKDVEDFGDVKVSEGLEAPEHVMTVLPVDVTTPGSHPSLANRISLCLFPLPTGKMDRVSRLLEVHERLNVLKDSPDLLVNYFALDLLANLLPVPLARRALSTHGVTMVASNMPGPQHEIQLFGAPVHDIMFWIPNKSRTGLGVSMLSYNGAVSLGLNVDSVLIPTRAQAQRLVDDAASEVNNILRELMLQKIKRERAQLLLKHGCEAGVCGGGRDGAGLTSDKPDQQGETEVARTRTYSDLLTDSVQQDSLDDDNDEDWRHTSLYSDDCGASESQLLLGRELRCGHLLGRNLMGCTGSPYLHTTVRSDTDLERACQIGDQHRFVQSDVNLKVLNGSEIQTR